MARPLKLSILTGVLVFGVAIHPSSASAAGSQSRPDLAFAAGVSAALLTTPSDAQLRGATEPQVVDASVRCVLLNELPYCLHVGWEAPKVSEDAVRERIASQSARAKQYAAPTADGDETTLSALLRWAALPAEARLESEKAELEEAERAAGKALLMDSVINGTVLPENFRAIFPADAPLADRLFGSTLGAQAITPTLAMTCESGNTLCGYAPMSTSKMEKQNTYYNCGAASMQAIEWNDPGDPGYASQAYWESVLGTTPADGTYIGNIKDAINNYTIWDSSSYAGTYIVGSISSWTVDQFRSLFRSHFRSLSGPVQLHPVLNTATSTYYPGVTGGHFDVGYWYDYSVNDWVGLYEPAGGAPQSYVYPSVAATEDTTHIRLAQRANSNQNIAY